MDIFIYASYALYHLCSGVIMHLSAMVYEFLCNFLWYLQHIHSTSMHWLFYSVMYVLHFYSGVIMHITELVYVFLYSYLRYAPVYLVPMRCLFMFSYVHFSVLLCLDYAKIWYGLRLFIQFFTLGASTYILTSVRRLFNFFNINTICDAVNIWLYGQTNPTLA